MDRKKSLKKTFFLNLNENIINGLMLVISYYTLHSRGKHFSKRIRCPKCELSLRSNLPYVSVPILLLLPNQGCQRLKLFLCR